MPDKDSLPFSCTPEDENIIDMAIIYTGKTNSENIQLPHMLCYNENQNALINQETVN